MTDESKNVFPKTYRLPKLDAQLYMGYCAVLGIFSPEAVIAMSSENEYTVDTWTEQSDSVYRRFIKARDLCKEWPSAELYDLIIRPEKSITLHRTGEGYTLCTDCVTTATHIDLIDGWIEVVDAIESIAVDTSGDTVFCDGCNLEILS